MTRRFFLFLFGALFAKPVPYVNPVPEGAVLYRTQEGGLEWHDENGWHAYARTQHERFMHETGCRHTYDAILDSLA